MARWRVRRLAARVERLRRRLAVNAGRLDALADHGRRQYEALDRADERLDRADAALRKTEGGW